MVTNTPLYRRVIKASEGKFGQMEVYKCLIAIKYRDEDTFDSDKQKEELFILLSKITVKGINNFFSLVRQAEVPKEKIIHTEEDIMAECYVVLNNCVKQLKVKYAKHFAFYYNSSLNRAIFRIYKQNYEKHNKITPNTDDNEKVILNNLKSTQHFDTLAVDLKNFTPAEMLVMQFKISGAKLKMFLKEHNITSIQYYEILDSVKAKLTDLYGDEISIILNNK